MNGLKALLNQQQDKENRNNNNEVEFLRKLILEQKKES